MQQTDSGRDVPDTRLGVSPSGVYELRWTERDPATGRARTRRKSCRTTDKGKAKLMQRAWSVAGATVDASVAGERMPLRELVSTYVEARGASGQAQGWALRRIVADLGAVPVVRLTGGMVDAYVSKRLRDVASGTVRREIGALRSAVAWGKKRGIVRADVHLHVALPAAGAPRTNYLSESEEARMFDLAAAQFRDEALPWRRRRIGLFICIALETAARERAVCGLTWSRVDTTTGLIDYRDPNMRVTKKRRVPVPVSLRLQPLLDEARERNEALAVPSEFVLGSDAGVFHGFCGFRERHGFGAVTVHDLRRTWASLRVQWGVPIGQVAGVLGDTIEVTERHYAHLSPDYLRSAVNARGAARQQA